jgi:Domain of unknown function (DUF4832)
LPNPIQPSIHRINMKSLFIYGQRLALSLIYCAFQSTGAVFADTTTVENDWVTVRPPEFQGAINNPLKGFRDYKKDGYGLILRQYMAWNDIEMAANDSVERIIAHTNKIAMIKGKRIEDLNLKLVPRVFLDWDGDLDGKKGPQQHWPTDLQTFDYDSPAFNQRLIALVAKLGQAWDEDPRIFAVQMGLIGRFGEHHNPAPTKSQRQLLADAFKKAFKNKPVLVRHNDPEFMAAGFGIYYDTFATISREPPDGPKDQFPSQATYVFPDVWKKAPIEGEVEYNWQMQRKEAKPEETFGKTPDETMKNPAYRRYMIDKIRRYHASYLGWIDNYSDSIHEVLAGAGELQKAFGYRFVLDSVSYPLTTQPGAKLPVKLTVRNTGSAPFYLDWPVAVALLDPATAEPVWSAPLSGIDIRKWMAGEDWDSQSFTYRKPPTAYQENGTTTLPRDLKKGQYILALSILDRQGGMLPSVRFATSNYYQGGWHPLGFIGIGETPKQPALSYATFESPAFDKTLHYKVPEKLTTVKAPPVPTVKSVTPWKSDPKVDLINPSRYWSLSEGSENVEKQILHESQKIIRVTGDFGKGTSLKYDFGSDVKLGLGHYQFSFRARGTASQSIEFELADDWRGVSKEPKIALSQDWKEHRIIFEIKNEFKQSTTLRFNLEKGVKGTFDLTAPRLIQTQ